MGTSEVRVEDVRDQSQGQEGSNVLTEICVNVQGSTAYPFRLTVLMVALWPLGLMASVAPDMVARILASRSFRAFSSLPITVPSRLNRTSVWSSIATAVSDWRGLMSRLITPRLGATSGGMPGTRWLSLKSQQAFSTSAMRAACLARSIM